jgi:hypothetical protein
MYIKAVVDDSIGSVDCDPLCSSGAKMSDHEREPLPHICVGHNYSVPDRLAGRHSQMQLAFFQAELVCIRNLRRDPPLEKSGYWPQPITNLTTGGIGALGVVVWT